MNDGLKFDVQYSYVKSEFSTFVDNGQYIDP